MPSPKKHQQASFRAVSKTSDSYLSVCSTSEGEPSRFTSGPLIPDDMEMKKPVKCEKTIFSDGRTPVPMSASHKKSHPPHVPTGTTEVLTFYPTMEEFRDFKGYIEKIERNGAHLRCGIAKIVPPEGWTPRPGKKDFSECDDYEIQSPVEETLDGKSGIYFKSNQVFRKKMLVKDYKKLANSAKYRNPKPGVPAPEIEANFFKNLTTGNAIYGADTEGTVWDPSVHEFNMNELGTILDETKVDGKVPGVNSVYLYFGMYKTTFPWHAEDMDLYSINYLHFGAPKYWFAIPSESSDRFERFMAQLYPEQHNFCKAFLRHKQCLITPSVLKAHNIPFGTMMQRPGEFIITFPKGYHMGFNTGYNLAESTNFALDRWIDFGKNSVQCKCRQDMVQIDMIPFMKKYRPNEFAQWHSYWYEPRIFKIKKKTNGKRKITCTTPIHSLEHSPTKQWTDQKKRRVSAGCELRGRVSVIIEAKKKQKTATSTKPLDDSDTKYKKYDPFETSKTALEPVLALSLAADEPRSPENSRNRSPIVQQTKFSTGNYDVNSALELSTNTDMHRSKWKKFSMSIWASSPVNLFLEKEYNDEESKYWPHCAVCSYMQPLHMRPKAAKVPKRSRRLLHSRSFAKYAMSKEEEETVEEQLLTCSNCHVVVHPSCYAGDDVTNERDLSTWKCLRCRNPSDVIIRSSSCSLCELRGGALIPCKVGNDETFAHTICALFNRRTVFDREIGPSSCQTSPPPKQFHSEALGSRLPMDYLKQFGNDHERAKFECDLCQTSREGLIVCTLCHESTTATGAVPSLAHVTCARQVGFFLEQRNYPEGVVMICDRHNTTHLYEEAETNLRQINVNEQVLMMDSDDNYVEKGVVEEISTNKFAVIDFLDSSVSRDSSPKDIIQCECIKCDKVNHQLGSRVEVQWNDNETYSGYFRGLVDALEYKVRFANGTYNNVRRGRLFASNDSMKSPMKRILNSN